MNKPAPHLLQILCAGLSLLFLSATLAIAPASATAETLTVRLDFSRFNQAALQTPLTGKNYFDFEHVDADTTFIDFQERVLKAHFPELRVYGVSPETVLAFTDANGLLYDGFGVVGLVAQRPDPATVVFYIWEGMRYLQWQMGGREVPELDVLVYGATPDARPGANTAPPSLSDAFFDDARFGDVIGTNMVLNEVILNRESVFISVRKGDLSTLFTQSIENAAEGFGLRLVLTALQPENGLRLHYNQKALETLRELDFYEVCLVVGDLVQVSTVEQLQEGL